VKGFPRLHSDRSMKREAGDIWEAVDGMGRGRQVEQTSPASVRRGRVDVETQAVAEPVVTPPFVFWLVW
jgi:hypothetical protein